jgi:hypothetical protein
MEFWWKANSTTQSNYSNVINQGFTGSPSNGAFAFKVYAGTGNNVLNFTYYNSGISDNATTANVNDLAWHHIAASRNGTSLGIYIDGVLNTTITLPASFNMGASGGTTYIGYNPRDASYINGNVKDVRIISGQALYSGTFTPPTAPLTTTSVGSTGAGAAATLTGTVLLLTCQNTSLNDVSSNAYAITNTNTVTSSPLLPNNLGIDTSGTGWAQPTVLIEPAATNVMLYSNPVNWNNVTVNNTANSATAPDGTTTAPKIVATAVNDRHIVYYAAQTLVTGSPYAYSVFVKAAGYNYAQLGLFWNSGGANTYIIVDLTTGAITSSLYDATNGAVGTSVINVGNGWYKLAITVQRMPGTSNHGIIVAPSNSGTPATSAGSPQFTGDGTSGIYAWGGQCEQGWAITSHIPTSGSIVTRAQDDVGSGSSGIFGLEDQQNSTAIDDQSTVTSFTVVGNSTWTAPQDVTSVEVLVVAGGGSGEGDVGGGGGAGGVVYNTNYSVVPGTTYPVTVGAGGVPSATYGANTGRNGGDSQFGTLIAIGGGSGGYGTSSANSGGSGGGGGQYNGVGTYGAPGVTGQGYAGGNSVANSYVAGGGGGAGASGTNGDTTLGGGKGGAGLYFNISGTSTAYGGGGGGGVYSLSIPAGTGGAGGGGNATGTGSGNPGGTGVSGTINTGGGGGGGGVNSAAGSGGSGIVIIKYKRTPRQLTSTSNAALVVQKFTTTNTWTVPTGVTQVEALVVAGGGGGGNGTGGGGGGAGGVVYSSSLSVTPGSTYTIGVGYGGIGATDSAAAPAYNGSGSGIGTGTELITNGSGFTTTTGWSATTATLSVPSTGTFRILPNASVNGTASQSVTTVNGTTYVVVVRVTNDPGRLFRLRIGTTQVGAEITDAFTAYTKDTVDNGATGAGFYSTTFTATGTTTWINLQVGGGTQQATDITYISVRQSSLPAFGGGAGGSESGTPSVENGSNGGSGGGTSFRTGKTAGTGVAGQGNAGGIGYSGVANLWTGGGGGGAASVGGNATAYYPGNGGAGVAYSITGNLEYYGGGGGGSSQNYGVGTVYSGIGGIGGGGSGFADQTSSTVGPGQNGAPNTGGGGGAQANQTGSGGSGNGGSGVVIIRYRVPAVATFLDSGTWTCPAGVTSVQALVVAGGGGGGATPNGSSGGGGGGAGGLVYSSSIPVTPGATYSVVVGQGGVGGAQASGLYVGGDGKNSSFTNIVAYGGGGGGQANNNPLAVGRPGGSGGGGGATYGATVFSPGPVGGAGTYGQGNAGGTAYNSTDVAGQGSGGGGGAGGAGGSGATLYTAGAGGNGLAFSISGSSVTYAGGGGGGMWFYAAPGGAGGSGGGGNGSSFNNSTFGTPGQVNTGGGGGGGGSGSPNSTGPYGVGFAGGSGIVIIRWIGG